MTAHVRDRHVPVLLAQVLESLGSIDGSTIVDGTFGAGGYTRAVLGAGGRVIAIDRDPQAIAGGADLAAEFPDRLTLVQGRFSEMDEIAGDAGCPAVDGVMLDVGVSSMQLDEAGRGFSFQADGPLDMRMSQAGVSAAGIVNTAEEQTIADILFHYGEERRSRAIARAIVKQREIAPIETTRALAEVVTRVLGPQRHDQKHPATRTFQALRIAVNDELGELARGLAAAERLLRPGGRLAVVSFHSLEDRIVKRFLQVTTGREPGGSRHAPPAGPAPAPSFEFINHRPVNPSDEEIASNPRARSAKLRTAVRTAALPRGLDLEDLCVPEVDTGR